MPENPLVDVTITGSGLLLESVRLVELDDGRFKVMTGRQGKPRILKPGTFTVAPA